MTIPVQISTIKSIRSYPLLMLLSCLWFWQCSNQANAPLEEEKISFIQTGRYQGVYWPTAGWRKCAPQETGLDSALLMQAYQYAVRPELQTTAILVIHKGYLVAEAYISDLDSVALVEGYSWAKGFTNAAMGIAVDQGLVGSIDDYAYQYLSRWNQPNTQPLKKRVKIRHLLTMMGGLDWNYNPDAVDDYIMLNFANYFDYLYTKSVLFEPGTYWNYSNGEALLLSDLIGTVAEKNVNDFLDENLFTKIGINDMVWSSDRYGHTNTAYGIQAPAREYAKLGYLYLNRGAWNAEQLISKQWIDQSTTPISDSLNHYGFYWWLPPGFVDYDVYDIPDSTFLAIGAWGQKMYIVPEKHLLILRMAQDPGSQTEPFGTMKFLSLILQAVKE